MRYTHSQERTHRRDIVTQPMCDEIGGQLIQVGGVRRELVIVFAFVDKDGRFVIVDVQRGGSVSVLRRHALAGTVAVPLAAVVAGR